LNLKELSSLDDVKRAIKDFKKQELLKPNQFDNLENYIDYVDSIFNIFFPILPSVIQYQNLLDFKGFNFYRVRESSFIQNKEIVSEYSYPPFQIANAGRCNFKNHPVFYCSNDLSTSILEVIKDADFKGKVYTVSIWSLKEIHQNFTIDYFLRNDLPKNNIYQKVVESYINNLNVYFDNKLSNSQISGIIELLRFLDNVFIQDKNYELSAYLAHKKLYSKNELRCNMIMYPSKESNLEKVNLAISPNFVDQYMTIERLYKIEINYFDIENRFLNLNILEYGIMNNNKIEWRKIDSNDSDYEEFFNKDFKNFLINFNFEISNTL